MKQQTDKTVKKKIKTEPKKVQKVPAKKLNSSKTKSKIKIEKIVKKVEKQENKKIGKAPVKIKKANSKNETNSKIRPVKNTVKTNTVKNVAVKTTPAKNTVSKTQPVKSASKSKKGTGKNIKALIVALVIFALILSGGIYFLIWNANREFEITLVDVAGVEYEGYDALTVKNGTTFTFTLNIDSSVVAYSALAKITANGTALTPESGVYSVKILENTTIVAQGYGTSGIDIDGGIIQTGVNIANVVIPYGVTEIKTGAFSGMTSIQSVFIPSSVQIIRMGSFYSCTNLLTVTISDSTYKMEYMAFDNTSWLSNQPNGPVYLGKVFYTYKGTAPSYCNLSITDGTKGIASAAISNSQGNIISIIVPDSVEYIGDYAFVGCMNVSSVTIGDNVKQIGQRILESTLWYNQQTSGLIYLNNWVYGFKGTLNTSSLTISDGKVGIAGYAFYQLSGLTTIDIPESVKYICSQAFYETGITSLELSDNIEFIGSYAFYGAGITGELIIPSSVKYIDSCAFESIGITSLTINCDLNILNEHVFEKCNSLTSVTINGNITNIAGSAVKDCSALTSLTLYNQIPPVVIGTSFLSGVNSGIQIYVLPSCLNTYKSASVWSAFGDKIFAIGS